MVPPSFFDGDQRRLTYNTGKFQFAKVKSPPLRRAAGQRFFCEGDVNQFIVITRRRDAAGCVSRKSLP